MNILLEGVSPLCTHKLLQRDVSRSVLCRGPPGDRRHNLTPHDVGHSNEMRAQWPEMCVGMADRRVCLRGGWPRAPEFSRGCLPCSQRLFWHSFISFSLEDELNQLANSDSSYSITMPRPMAWRFCADAASLSLSLSHTHTLS